MNNTPTAPPMAEVACRVADILKRHWDEESEV